jgi:hypothetical protein
MFTILFSDRALIASSCGNSDKLHDKQTLESYLKFCKAFSMYGKKIIQPESRIFTRTRLMDVVGMGLPEHFFLGYTPADPDEITPLHRDTEGETYIDSPFALSLENSIGIVGRLSFQVDAHTRTILVDQIQSGSGIEDEDDPDAVSARAYFNKHERSSLPSPAMPPEVSILIRELFDILTRADFRYIAIRDPQHVEMPEKVRASPGNMYNQALQLLTETYGAPERFGTEQNLDQYLRFSLRSQ